MIARFSVNNFVPIFILNLLAVFSKKLPLQKNSAIQQFSNSAERCAYSLRILFSNFRFLISCFQKHCLILSRNSCFATRNTYSSAGFNSYFRNLCLSHLQSNCYTTGNSYSARGLTSDFRNLCLSHLQSNCYTTGNSYSATGFNSYFRNLISDIQNIASDFQNMRHSSLSGKQDFYYNYIKINKLI